MTTLAYIDVKKKELPIYQECNQKIIQNLERQLESGNVKHENVSRVLAMRWFLSEEIMIKEI